MASGFFKNVSIWAAALELAAAGAFAASGRTMAALGVLVAAAWIFLNFYFLVRLFEIGFRFENEPRVKDRILVLSVLKFPVLYVAGYFILKTRVFPAAGILAGLTVFMAVFTLLWLRLNAGAPQRQAS